jgi:hypothetical protein
MKEKHGTRVIVMCGSSRFFEVMAVCAWLIERDETAITMGLHSLPAWYPTAAGDHLAEAEGCAERMDDLHLRKIDLADAVFVVDVGNYVGKSTRREINYAVAAGKDVRWYTSDPVGAEVQEMIQRAWDREQEWEKAAPPKGARIQLPLTRYLRFVDACEAVVATAHGNRSGLTPEEALQAQLAAAREAEGALGSERVRALLARHGHHSEESVDDPTD